MFFKKIFFAIALMTMIFGGMAPSSESKKYVLESLKQLRELVERKKSAKQQQLQLNNLFDGYVDDALQLLNDCDKQSAEETAKDETVKQIGHYIAILQKLLSIMNSSVPEPLEYFCLSQQSDELWGSVCGDRPTKRVLRKDVMLKNEENPMNKRSVPEFSSSHATQYSDDQEVQIGLG